MGKLPGLDRLKVFKQSELLEEVLDTDEKSDEIAEDVPEVWEEYKPIDLNFKVDTAKYKSPDKATKDTPAKIISSKVSESFKLKTQLYCINNDIKEIDLIERELKKVMAVGNVNELKRLSYNTTDEGKDTSKMIYGRYSTQFKKQVVTFAKLNKVTEGWLVAQAVALAIR